MLLKIEKVRIQYLRLILFQKFLVLCRIAASNLNIEVAAMLGKTKQELDMRHILHRGNFMGSRFKEGKTV